VGSQTRDLEDVVEIGLETQAAEAAGEVALAGALVPVGGKILGRDADQLAKGFDQVGAEAFDLAVQASALGSRQRWEGGVRGFFHRR
jgi:hypothetical protein